MTFDPFWIIHLILRFVLEIFYISTLRIILWLLEHHTFQKQKSLFLFPSQILVCATGFCSSMSLFIWRFTFSELFCKNIKIKVGRYIGTSLCKFQDKQDYWPIIHDKLEDLFTTTTKKMPISDQEFMTDPKSPLKKSYLWWQNKALANTW